MTTENIKILLFDMDGVLVQPGGYGAGADVTLKYFFDKFHLPLYADDHRMRVWFEAAGVSSEWDMVPITLAVILDRMLGFCPSEHQLETFEQVSRHFEKVVVPETEFVFQSIVQTLQPHFSRQPAPADAVLDLIKSDEGGCLFSALKKHPGLAGLILRHSRDEGNSAVNRIFQNYVLGDRIFEQVYGRKAEFEAESVLLKHDKPLLSSEWQKKIMQFRQVKKAFPVAYTARPSSAPKEKQDGQLGYSPEAEMALSLLGFETVPVIGYGRLVYTGSVYGMDADSLVKPSPYQALAAVMAAWSGREWEALQWAMDIYNNQTQERIASNDELPRKFELHVFEDSAGGIRAVNGAAEILQRIGYDVSFFGWGIATVEEKVRALQKTGAPVFEDVNLALHAALE
jgi:hypothetical protein